MYTIGEVARRFGISVSAIRYYDREGLLPGVRREGGIRKFGEKDIETMFLIECLKKTGLELKDIRRFIALAEKGDSTIEERLLFFQREKEKTRGKIQELEKALEMLSYKEWYYRKAKELGSVGELERNMGRYRPKEIQELYERAHRK